MRFDPHRMKGAEVYRLMADVVVPRPIAFVSTMSAEGRVNLAPFSFFNAVTSRPPLVSICVGYKRIRGADGREVTVPKDTARNVLETGELVINVVTEDIVEAMNRTAAEYPHGWSEFEIAGLTPAPAERVRPPRVAESPVAMECRLFRHVDLAPARTHMLVAEVVLFHVDESLLDAGGRVAVDRLRPVGRLGGNAYSAAAARTFDLVRPEFPPEPDGGDG